MNEKIALVTNSCQYAGRPAVVALFNEGFTVICHDISFTRKENIERIAREFPGAVATTIQEPEELVAYVEREYGRIDALVSNDCYPAVHTTVEDADITELTATLDRVVVFPFRLMKAAAALFKRQESGRVVMITSCRTDLPMPGGAIPDIARAGANAFVTSLSLELAPYGVPVNAVAPNYLYSEAYYPKAVFVDTAEGRAFIESEVPAGRLGEPEEIGELICYLATMKGAFQTGSIIKFSGGWPVAAPRLS